MPEEGPVVFPRSGTTEYRKELIVNGESPAGNPLQNVGPLHRADGLRLYGEFYEPAHWLVFVQDPSGAIFLLKSGHSADFRTDSGYLPFPTPPFGNHVIWLATSEQQLPDHGSLQADLQRCGNAFGSLARIHFPGQPGIAPEALAREAKAGEVEAFDFERADFERRAYDLGKGESGQDVIPLRGLPGKAREAATWPFDEYRKRLQQSLGEEIRLQFPVPFRTVPAVK